MAGLVRMKRKAAQPRNPWVKDNLVRELYLLGKYGLRNKKELWTVLAQAQEDKKRARTLLITTDHKVVMTEGRALCNKLYRNGMISSVDFNDEEDIRRCLREVLNFDLTKYLDRRLQQLVVNVGIAKNVHQARKMITHRHITMKGRVVNKPSMVVRSENDGHIELNPYSTMAGFKKGRSARKAGDEPREE